MEKLNILVCEDTEANIAAAEAQLSDHNLSIACTLTEAMQVLGNQACEDIPAYVDKTGPITTRDFNVVLTDMYMPGGHIDGLYKFAPGVAPVGVMIALRAASIGIKHVGLMSDANHHQDAMMAGIDMLSGTWFTTERSLQVNSSTVVITTAKMVRDDSLGEYVKDWRALLEGLMSSS